MQFGTVSCALLQNLVLISIVFWKQSKNTKRIVSLEPESAINPLLYEMRRESGGKNGFIMDSGDTVAFLVTLSVN
jgi:hypothetical protein